MGTLRLFKTSAVHRLLTFLRLRSFPRARGDFGSSLPYPELGADHPANEPGIPASIAANRARLIGSRNPDPMPLDEFYRRHKPVPDDDDFLKERPAIREIRDGIATFENGAKIDAGKYLNPDSDR